MVGDEQVIFGADFFYFEMGGVEKGFWQMINLHLLLLTHIDWNLSSFLSPHLSYALFLTWKVPLVLDGLEGRYATALYRAAKHSQRTAQVEQDLAKLKQKIDSNAGVRSFLVDPTISRNDKRTGVEVILKDLKSTDDITRNFLNVVAENGRLDMLVKCMESYRLLLGAERGEINVIVTSAKVSSSCTRPFILFLFSRWTLK